MNAQISYHLSHTLSYNIILSFYSDTSNLNMLSSTLQPQQQQPSSHPHPSSSSSAAALNSARQSGVTQVSIMNDLLQIITCT